MNSTLVDSNSDEEIALDITDIHNEKVLDNQSLTGCHHSGSPLNEEGNDIFTIRATHKSKTLF